jgi:twitching motility two-component system response regulator PilH
MSTVLIVEDSFTQREILSELFKRIGLNVILASDGVEALAKIESHPPDLVILDIIMPQMNGYEVCRRLKSNVKTQKIAVLMFSTKSKQCDYYWGRKQGADAYISKLCHPQELINAVEQLLRKDTCSYYY